MKFRRVAKNIYNLMTQHIAESENNMSRSRHRDTRNAGEQKIMWELVSAWAAEEATIPMAASLDEAAQKLSCSLCSALQEEN